MTDEKRTAMLTFTCTPTIARYIQEVADDRGLASKSEACRILIERGLEVEHAAQKAKLSGGH